MSLPRSILISIIWIFILFFIVFLSRNPSYFPYSYEKDSIDPQSISILWHLSNFDGVHYQNIATRGYITSFQTNFFPLYPLLINIFGNLFQRSYLIAGILISLLSLLGSVTILRKLSKSPHTIILFLLFPTSFFLISGYTESLFIFLSLFVWYQYKSKNYILATVFGIFLSATRYYGILLLPMILVDFFFKLKPVERFKLKSYLQLFPFLFLPVGLLTYMAFLKFQFNNPFQFHTALAMWHKSDFTFPLQTLFRYMKIFTSVPIQTVIFWVAFLEFASFILGIYAAYIFLKARQYSYSFYCFVGTLIPTFTGTLQSQPRYLLSLFPIFLLPSIIKINKKILFVIYLLGGLLQLVLFRLFLSGVFVS